jgi:ATP-dependent HslUV protease subunit HslV
VRSHSTESNEKSSVEEVVSTVAVVKKNGHVAIAADTLSSFGSRKLSAVHNKRASKIVRLGSSFVGLTGAAANLRVLEHVFRDAEAPALDSAAAIFDVFLKLHERLTYEYAMNVRRGEAYESTEMTLLIANQHGIFGIYSMREVVEHERFWAAGSGGDYALGAMHAVYDVAADAVSIAEAGVRAGVEFDDGTGAPVESHVIRLPVLEVEELELLLKL